MATGKKKPTTARSTPSSTAKTPIAPRAKAQRNAAKPPVINLKATEVKSGSADSSENKTTKPIESKSAASKPASKPDANKDTKPASTQKNPVTSKTTSKTTVNPAPKASDTKAPKKKKGKTGLVLVSLAALIAAGFGGAWAFKQYGQKFFTSPNAENTAQIAAIGEKLSTTTAQIDQIKTSIANVSKQVASNKDNHTKTVKGLTQLQASLTQVNTALKAAAKKGTGPADAANTLALEKLTTKLASVDTALQNLKKTTANSNASSTQTNKDLTKIKSQLEAMTQALSKAQADSKSANDQLAATTKAMAILKAAQAKLENAPTSSQSGKLASAFTILRAKISNGQPFLDELNQITTSLPQELSLDKLRTVAETGAPTNATLLKSLTKLSLVEPTNPAPQKNDAEATKDNNGMWNTLSGKLTGLVKVSKVGDIDWQQVQNTAANHLKSGDLKAAINTITAAKQAPPKPLSNWLTKANKKTTIDAAVAQLSASVMARLTTVSQ